MRRQNTIDLTSQHIILDRDGVINVDAGYVGAKKDWRALEGSVEAIAALTQAGYQLFVVTNQSGIGRGYYTEKDFQAVDRHMHQVVAQAGGRLVKTYYCPHTPQQGCDCRKPASGLFEQIKEDYHIDLTGVIFVGDKYSDLMAGDAIGAQSILVRTGYGEQTLSELPVDHGYPVYADLRALVQAILPDCRI